MNWSGLEPMPSMINGSELLVRLPIVNSPEED